jgi:hypothetical protein
MRVISLLGGSLLALGLAFPATTHAQLLDAAGMIPGDSFTGEISSDTDVDIVNFDTVAGAGFVITVAGKGKVDLIPTIQLIDTSDDSVVAEITATKKKATLKVANSDKGDGVPTTGVYEIHVSGDGGTTGTYTLKFREQLPKTVKKIDTTEEIDNGDDLCVFFDAGACFEATLIAQLGKKSPADPEVPVLTDPSDVDIDVPDKSLKSNKKGNKHTLKKIKLEESGTYKFTVTNEGDDGGLRAKIKLKRAKAKKRKLEELPIAESSTSSLAGHITGTDGTSLEGVGVQIIVLPDEGITLAGTQPPTVLAETATDENGNFVAQDLPLGEVEVILDGSTVTNGGLSEFGTLIIMAEVSGEGDSEIPQNIVLADLANPDSANQDVSTTGGTTNEAIDAQGAGAVQLGVSGPLGTGIMLGGVPADGMVDINVTPVPPDQVPMPLVDDDDNPLDASSYVTVQPPNAEFDTSGGGFPTEGLLQGLDATFPNNRGFPPGTMLDVWSFDHDEGEWMNRSAQTGQQGEVSGDGLTIDASGVILKGGWHAPVLPIDPGCATKIVGRIVDLNTGDPVPGTTIATDLGQFATSDANGDFTINSVPAYGLPNPPCLAIGVNLSIVTAVDYGAVSSSLAISAGAIVTGDCTDVGDIQVDVPAKGTLSGRVVNNGQPVAGAEVRIEGEETFTEITDADGRFFRTCVLPGSYIARHLFDGDSADTESGFGISPNQITTINIQRALGQGKKTITICVFRDQDSFILPFEPVAGAKVTLQGSDAGSSGGLFGTTNADGQVTFEKVNPPYTITAQRDVVIVEDGEPEVLRQAVTLLDLSPKGSKVGVALEDDFEDDNFQVPDATFSGTLSNIPSPPPGGDSFVSYEVELYDPQTFSGVALAFVSEFDGSFNVGIVSGGPFHAIVRQKETFFDQGPPGFGGEVTQTTAAFPVLDVDAVGPGETLVLDLDFDDAIPFDREVPLVLENFPEVTTYTGNFFAGLCLYDESRGVDELPLGVYFNFSFGKGNITPPETIRLPDVNDPALDGYDMFFFTEVVEFGDKPFLVGGPSFFNRGTGCDIPVDKNLAKLEAEYQDFVQILSPAHFSQIDVEDIFTTLFQYDDEVPVASRGYSSFFIDADSVEGLPGIDITGWEFIQQGKESQITLPSNTALPMFGTAGEYFICLESEAFDGVTTIRENIFTADLQQNWKDIWFGHDGACFSFIETTFIVGDPFIED